MGQAAKKNQKQPKLPPPGNEVEVAEWWALPMVGNVITIAAAISLQFTIILLPLVGPAGAVAPHATKNSIAWHFILFVAMGLSVLALLSKLKRRTEDASRFPLLSTAMLGVTLFLFVAQAAGWLSV